MATLDKEIRVIALKGERGQSSYELAVEEELFSGTLQEWIETFATPENYITRTEFQKVTQAQYDAMEQAGTLVTNCYYLIIDDTTAEDFNQLQEDVSTIQGNLTDIQDDITNLQNSVNDLEAIHLYRHSLYLEDYVTLTRPNTGANLTVYLEVITNTNSPIKTFADLRTFVGAQSLIANGNVIGVIDEPFISPIVFAYVGTNNIIIKYLYNNDTEEYSYISSNDVFTDTIKQIF